MRVVICGLLKFPAGDAGAIRQEKMAQLLMQMGHEILVVGLGPAHNEATAIYNGISYISLREQNPGLPSKVKMRLLYWSRLKKTLKEYRPQVILVDDLGPGKMQRLKALCRRKGILLIHDSVEWYSPEQFRWGKLSLRYIRKNHLNRHVIDDSCRCIAISKYLLEHFRSRGIKTVNIPIVVTPEDICTEKMLQADKVVFTYAGQPGKKDYLHVMLEAFMLLPEDVRARAIIRIIGCTAQQMVASGIPQQTLDALAPQLEIHGRVPRSTVLELLKETDFTLLMRSAEQRYAKAGFPTKVVESLSTSTPVICNLTSDLADYLTDGQDALIVDTCSPASLKLQLERAIRMSYGQRMQMCNDAAKTAQSRFLYTNFAPQMQTILD